MNPHPYLRAYLAGVFIPTLVLPIILTGFIVVRLLLQFPVPIERGIIFPMALVPALWGLWNVLWHLPALRTRVPLGIFGALLPPLMVPVGAAVGVSAGVVSFGANSILWMQEWHFPYAVVAGFFCVALTAYYLIWKYVVGFLNRTLGIA
jgi:hypothetical protein